MKHNLTFSEIIALVQTNKANIERERIELLDAVISIVEGRGVPSPPNGWTEGRWRAAVKTFYRQEEENMKIL